MAVTWLRKNYNNERPQGIFGNVSRVCDTEEGDDQWHSWDFEVEPGIYSLSYVSRNSSWGNYFAVGTIQFPNQVTPMKPEDRFGEIAYIPPLDNMIIRQILEPLIFVVNEGQVLRIESWACYIGRINTTTLPDGLSHWRVFGIRRNGPPPNDPTYHVIGEILRIRTNNFGVDFQSVSKRKFTENSVLFGAEDGGDSDFNDMVVELKQISINNDHYFFYSGANVINESHRETISVKQFNTDMKTINAKNKNFYDITLFFGPKNNQPPSWVTRDHTTALLQSLKLAKYESIPKGISNVNQAKRILNIFYYAGLEFKVHVAHYDNYVPVYIVVPGAKLNSTPPLPDRCRVDLSEEDIRQSLILRDRFDLSPEATAHASAFEFNSRTADWELAQVIAGRIGSYLDFIEAGEDLNKIARSFTLGFYGTLFGIAGMYVDAQGISNVHTKLWISCPAAIISAPAVSLSAPLGIGIIGLISTLQLAADCIEGLNEGIINPLVQKLKEISFEKQLAKTLSKDRPIRSYERDGNRLLIERNAGEIDSIDINIRDGMNIDVSGRNHQGSVERKIERYGNDEWECMRFQGRETDANGNWRESEGWGCRRNLQTGSEYYEGPN